MNSNDNTDRKPARRGRPPLGDQAMTVTERKRASRERQRREGAVELSIRLESGTVRLLDALADAGQVNRTEVMQLLLDHFLDRVQTTLVTASAMQTAGVSDSEVATLIRNALTVAGAPRSSTDGPEQG
jgi:hypothetical protein